jgi:hypothetical protein
LPVILACTQIAIDVQEVIETRSCTDDAVSMQVFVESSGLISDVTFEGGSPNVLGAPVLLGQGGGLLIVADLNSVDTGELVTLRYGARVTLANPLTFTTTDIEFFKLPWDGIVPPDCNGAEVPSFTLLTNALFDLSLQVTNPGSQPMTLAMLELAETNSALPSQSLDWEDPDFNALSWHSAVTGVTTLDPAGPSITIDLPDASSGGSVVLCRCISSYDGMEVRGIIQANLTEAPVAARRTTWGAVKALYR